MDWTKFNSYGESKNHAFEVMCNMIFNKMVKLEYKEKINHFAYVNGSGGDGGVEAYCELKDGTVIAIQSKWFLNRLESSQFTQLQNSLDTAIKVRPNISKYIICIPRDLTSKKVVKGGNVTENTEDNNWKEFKSKNEGLYPSVELILWDETAIYQRLTDSECTGIFKHFFEDASVSYNEIKLSFDKVKKGWAHTKYIPDLYSQGYIHETVQRFVGKNSNHPLGGRLLNHFLRGFGKPAERDVWWSIPAYLCSTYENDWCCYTEINFVEIEVNLEELDQTYTGMPLALAWRLSTVRESEKRKVRVALTQWGIQHEDEFIKLLKVMLDVNDMQIVEELLNVAYGIALSRTVSDAFLKECAEFLLGTIFSDSGLKKYENIVVRQYVIWIIKAAQNKKITLSTDTCNIYPPYKYDLDMMPACLAALDSSRMGGYGPIDYDLARYVLCDRFDAFFRQRYPKYKYTKEAEDFIRKYENKYSIKIEKIDGLIIGIAYQYLLDCGWNKEIFFSNKEREYSGVDSSILYIYPSATHGSRSSVSSVAEKYTWCARHKMFAVLSNYIPYSDYGYECQYLHDYAGIESFENAYQSYINAIKEVTVAKWYHTDRLAYLDG